MHILVSGPHIFSLSYGMGKRTECKEEEIVLQELRQTDRRHLTCSLGYITPVPRDQKYYSPSKEIMWQLQAMEGHRVYLEFSQIDLRNEDGNCSDYIEISFNPCTPPTRICDNRVNSYKWATSQTRVQVRFVSDHSKPTNGTGFRGAYYYYPVNTSSESTNSLCSHAQHVQVLKLLYAAHLHSLPVAVLSGDPLE